MGYLDNTSITVDAILTKKGRELLAKNDGSFDITQLTASNGSGKSTIALIIQEILFGKNIKGIKKGDILNRYGNGKSWSGSLSFTVDEEPYVVSVSRSGNSCKVNFYNGTIDLTEHKVLDTYKKIQEIVGLDFEVFSQLTYQSSTDLKF